MNAWERTARSGSDGVLEAKVVGRAAVAQAFGAVADVPCSNHGSAKQFHNCVRPGYPPLRNDFCIRSLARWGKARADGKDAAQRSLQMHRFMTLWCTWMAEMQRRSCVSRRCFFQSRPSLGSRPCRWAFGVVLVREASSAWRAPSGCSKGRDCLLSRAPGLGFFRGDR